MAQGIILTKYTFQCAAGKKDRSASAVSADTGLLPRMECGTGSRDLIIASAEAGSDSSVRMAHSRTEGAAFVGIGHSDKPHISLFSFRQLFIIPHSFIRRSKDQAAFAGLVDGRRTAGRFSSFS